MEIVISKVKCNSNKITGNYKNKYYGDQKALHQNEYAHSS